jgi:hypothetical protein
MRVVFETSRVDVCLLAKANPMDHAANNVTAQ